MASAGTRLSRHGQSEESAHPVDIVHVEAKWDSAGRNVQTSCVLRSSVSQQEARSIYHRSCVVDHDRLRHHGEDDNGGRITEGMTRCN
jgi:hypothetical protein